MKIPNYDKRETSNNFKQLYDYMPDRYFRMLICGKSGCGKLNTVLHMLIKPLIYYDKIYLYSKNLQVRFINFIPMQIFHKSLHTP